MTEFLIANESDKEEIIDFLNYVFSQSRIPHDFKTLIPKSYADDSKDMGATHYIARQNGKIKAVAACRTIETYLGGTSLKFGLIGNVAVHPYSRGEGFMKKILADIIADSKQNGIDLLVLSGQRQRYGYFGFENAGTQLWFTLSKENLRHRLADIDFDDISFLSLRSAPSSDIDKAIGLYESRPRYTLRDRDEYINIMHTCNAECNIIYKNGKMMGYSYNHFSELVLENEDDLAAVIKAIFAQNNLTEAEIPVSIFEKDRAAFLASVAESCSIHTLKMINVLNWEKVLTAFLKYKASFTDLSDGELNLCIDGETIHISASAGQPAVKKVESSCGDTIFMTKLGAQQAFFDLNSLAFPDNRFRNWAPLPFEIDAPDSY